MIDIRLYIIILDVCTCILVLYSYKHTVCVYNSLTSILIMYICIYRPGRT